MNPQKANYPDFPPNYVPNRVEIHDHLGKLAVIERLELIEEYYRPQEFRPEFICWYFDGTASENLAYSHTDRAVLVNRINQLQALTDLNQALGAAA